MPTSRATAVWHGGLKSGKGNFSAASGAFSGDYTAATRFEGARGTNPEELIVAAHAACFSMALAADLERDGHASEQISTNGAITLERVDGKPTITKIRLEVRGKVPGIDEKAFKKAAEGAKQGCPVSRALAPSIAVEVDAKLQ